MRGSATILLFLTVLAIAAATPALADDGAAGRRKVARCQPCHGLEGIAQIPLAPNLAGQQELYLVKALEDFRAGVRRNEMMDIVVKTLSDQDVADLAAWYASIRVTVETPQ